MKILPKIIKVLSETFSKLPDNRGEEVMQNHYLG